MEQVPDMLAKLDVLAQRKQEEEALLPTEADDASTSSLDTQVTRVLIFLRADGAACLLQLPCRAISCLTPSKELSAGADLLFLPAAG